MDDPRWTEIYSNLSEEKWIEMQEEAAVLFKEYESVKDPAGVETDNSPMSPDMFFQLCSISGFNRMNGYTFKEYLDKWKKRRT